MSRRFYPRSRQSRLDALAAPGKVFSLPLTELARRDGLAADPSWVQGTVAVTGGNSLGVKSIVAGGSNLLFTLTSSMDRWLKPNSPISAAIEAGLSAGFNVGSLASALTIAAFSVDVTGLKLNVLLPAIAAYSPGASTAFLWTFPKEAFKNSAAPIAVASALVVTSAA